MRRADRLFQIIQFLRVRRLTTAKWLSEKLEVSERTIYRDIQDLSISGVPIKGESGVGYILDKSYDLPPLMFDLDELTALFIGAKMASSLGGTVRFSSEKALAKLYSALPPKHQKKLDKIQIYSPNYHLVDYGTMIEAFNQAILERHIITIYYHKPSDPNAQNRDIYPLGIFFWQNKWTIIAWCLLRDNFRHFRLDRITKYQVLDSDFNLTDKQTLAQFLSTLLKK